MSKRDFLKGCIRRQSRHLDKLVQVNLYSMTIIEDQKLPLIGCRDNIFGFAFEYLTVFQCESDLVSMQTGNFDVIMQCA